MPKATPSSAEIRARIEGYTATKARVEAERDRLLADREARAVTMSDDDLDAIDADLAHFSAAADRAGERAELFKPALAVAEKREATAAESNRNGVAAAQARSAIRSVASTFGDRSAAIGPAIMATKASASPVRPYAQSALDGPPPPRVTYANEAKWFAEREARERAERAAASGGRA